MGNVWWVLAGVSLTIPDCVLYCANVGIPPNVANSGCK